MRTPIRYQFLLEAETPIAQAEGVRGNHSMLMMRKCRQPDGTYQQVPIVTADAMRHGLRETGALLCLQAAGLLDSPDGPQLNEAALRLLFTGGMLTGKGDASVVKVARWRELCETLPILGLMGGCVDAMMIPGKIQVGDCRLLCAETRHALPEWTTQEDPQPWTEQVEHCQRVRFDVTRDPVKQKLLSGEARAAAEGKLLAREAAHEGDDAKASAADRGRPMPHSYEAVASGSRWSWEITGTLDTEVEQATLMSTLALFFETWRVGGKRGTGHGKLRPVACKDIRLPSVAPQASDADVTALGGTSISMFRAHMIERKEKLAALLREVDA